MGTFVFIAAVFAAWCLGLRWLADDVARRCDADFVAHARNLKRGRANEESGR